MALERKRVTVEQIETRKQAILDLCNAAIARESPDQVQFEDKRRIIKMVVDQIVLNSQERTVTLVDTLNGTFPIVSKSGNLYCHTGVEKQPGAWR